MKYQHSPLLRCPLDHLALREEDRQLRCDNGHSFDIARHGYVNLLSSADKHSRDPGDSKAMVAARRTFFDRDHFQPVAGKLAELVVPLIANDSVVVDAGCGEGYYLEQLQAQLLSSTGFTPAVLGFDISKWAVQAATRRLVATWLVASNRNIPLAPGSVDCVLSVFGFPVYGSFMAVLKEGGSLLVVHPGPRHLIELREIIYPSVRHRELPLTQHAEAEAAGFAAGPTSTLQFVTAPLDQTEIAQLLTMTPHLYRASREGKERAAVLDNFPVTVDVVFQLLHPRPGASVTRSTPAQSVAV